MSCADVCLDMCYEDYNQFYSEEERTARKSHRCCECGETIHPGARYEHVSGKSDGRVWTSKTCVNCRDVRKALVCGGWIFGQLWEEIENGVFPEWVRSSPIDCLAKVESLAARNFIRSRFDSWRSERGDR